MFKNYIFDLYGTLIDINTDEWSDDLWEKMALLYSYKGADYSGKDFHNSYDNYCKDEKNIIKKAHPEYKDNVDIQIEKVFKKLFSAKGIEVTDKEVLDICAVFRCYSTKYIKLYDGVIDLLETLKAKGKKIYLLSNAQRSFTLNEFNMLGLSKYFDGVFISSDHQVSKPSPYFYNGLIKEFGLNKKECVMIGNDYKADIEGSKKAGIKSLYIHQSISPDIEGEVQTPWQIMDGDVYKIKKLIVK
jgi:putative hydrolase of the HAD superfamily